MVRQKRKGTDPKYQDVDVNSQFRWNIASQLILIQTTPILNYAGQNNGGRQSSIPFDSVAFVLEVGSHRFSKSDVYDVAPKATSQITE
jgi:hypothetical protein